MLTKEFFDKYFKVHNKIVLYTPDNIRLTISKAYHFNLNGGHQDFVDITIFQLKDMMKNN